MRLTAFACLVLCCCGCETTKSVVLAPIHAVGYAGHTLDTSLHGTTPERERRARDLEQDFLLLESLGGLDTPEGREFAEYMIRKYEPPKAAPSSPTQMRTASAATEPSTLRLNVYGPGIHQNQYGRPVTVQPDFGAVPGEPLTLQQNAYGPGVHMDQYGRPVRESPWP